MKISYYRGKLIILNVYWPKREEIKSLIYNFIHGTRESRVFKGIVNRSCFLIYYPLSLISSQYGLLYKIGLKYAVVSKLVTGSKQINNF